MSPRGLGIGVIMAAGAAPPFRDQIRVHTASNADAYDDGPHPGRQAPCQAGRQHSADHAADHAASPRRVPKHLW
ncbi:hypothetical protein ACQR35_07185 [Pseudarthrobacter sp. J1738]|uniref:hypothetical protein n=1 Tax=Pseudarthrobacter sp. J1738 TaxID=3420446 RepID=UPI003D268436